MFKSKHLITWFDFSPWLRAITPASSRLFEVRSRCNSEFDSGKNSARQIAPAEVMPVDDRNSLFNALLSVNAVRSAWICSSAIRIP